MPFAVFFLANNNEVKVNYKIVLYSIFYYGWKEFFEDNFFFTCWTLMAFIERDLKSSKISMDILSERDVFCILSDVNFKLIATKF